MSRSSRKKEDAKVLCWYVRRHLGRKHDTDLYIRAVFAIHEFRAKYPEVRVEEIAKYGDKAGS
jgi:hypothetical protein